MIRTKLSTVQENKQQYKRKLAPIVYGSHNENKPYILQIPCIPHPQCILDPARPAIDASRDLLKKDAGVPLSIRHHSVGLSFSQEISISEERLDRPFLVHHSNSVIGGS
jgi:hypothetical protein